MKLTRKGRAALRRAGRNVPKASRAFSNRELAIAAGRKGGLKSKGSKGSFATNPGLAASAGKKGGEAWHRGPDGVKRPHKYLIPKFPPWEY